MSVPSGTPGTGRTNARREKRGDVVTDRTDALETAEIQRQSQNPPATQQSRPTPVCREIETKQWYNDRQMGAS